MPPPEELGITLAAFLLGLQSLAYSGLLFWIGRKENSVLLCSIACLDISATSILYGILAGWGESANLPKVLWPVTVFLVAYLSFFLACGTAQSSIRNPARRGFQLALLLKFLISLSYLATRPEVRFQDVLWDYVTALAIICCFKAYTKFGRNDKTSNWILSGVAISFLALPVLASGFLANAWVNHITVFLLLQMVALHCFYSGARYKKDI